MLAADTACSAQLPKASRELKEEVPWGNMLIAFSLILHVHFLVFYFFSFKQLLQVLVCWAETPRQAVVSVSRLAVWLSMKVLDFALHSEKLLRTRLQELLKSLRLSLTKMQKENQTWCNSGEEGEEKHFKGAQELKFHFLYAFLSSIQ